MNRRLLAALQEDPRAAMSALARRVGMSAPADRFLLYGQTTTSIVVSTPVPPRPLPLTAPATT